MSTLRRVLSVAVMIVSVAVMIGCVYGVVEVWRFRQKAIATVQDLSGRLETAMRSATVAGNNVQNALELARANVTQVRAQSGKIGGNTEGNRLETAVLRRMIQSQVGPNINDLGGRLAIMSDSAVAISTLLQSMDGVTVDPTGHIAPGQPAQWADQTSQLAGKLQRLQGLVGEENQQTTERDVVEATREVEAVLELCQVTLARWQQELAKYSQRLPQLTADTLYWLHTGAIIVTILSIWVFLSQISVLMHARGWLRG